MNISINIIINISVNININIKNSWYVLTLVVVPLPFWLEARRGGFIFRSDDFTARSWLRVWRRRAVVVSRRWP